MGCGTPRKINGIVSIKRKKRYPFCKNIQIRKDKKLFTRVIMYRLTEKQLRERMKKQVYTESKKGITYSQKSKRLAGMNLYVTNTPWEIVPMEQIHDFYSLRWQVEIIFKTWKSLFQIHHWQNIKQDRLECHVYGILIAIFYVLLLCLRCDN